MNTYEKIFSNTNKWFLVKPAYYRICVIILLCALAFKLEAQSDGLPRGAYQMPYTRYESEDANRGGGAIYYENPEFDASLIAAEASGQKYVGLPNNGSYVEWTANEVADGITLRFTMPDAPGGEGETGSLDLYVNNNFVRTIDLTSYWAWQYFPGSEPEDHPGDRPRMRFDEVHFLLNNAIGPGDVVKIQKNNGDSFEYGVDFIEIEDVPAPLSKPAGFVSVTDHGAVPDDGNDDLSAFESALAAAGSAGTGVYIPVGRFELSNKWIVEENNIGILGAGMWHTEIYFSTEGIFTGGILARCSDVEIGHFYMNTINNQRFLNGQYVIYKGFMGTYGNNSSIHDVWVTHFECGAWIAGYDPPYPIDITYNLEFTRNRIRNNYADGINLCQGTSYTDVSHCNFRSNGDDAMAVWPDNQHSAPMAVDNIFRYNTVEHTYRAAGSAIFGGDGHEVHHCIIKDNHAGSGIRLTTDFPGYHFENTNAIRFYENTIIGCGTSNDLWNFHRGAIEINATGGPIQNVFFENIDIRNSQRHAVQIGGNGADLQFDNININGTGLDPYTFSNYTVPTEGAAVMTFGGSGTAVFNNLSMENIERDPPIYQANPNFNLIIENVNVALTGINLSDDQIELAVGETAPLTVNYSPTNASNKTVTWDSSNPSVATYDEIEGEVVAHATGTATITVTSQEGGFTDQCTVNVNAAVNIEANDDQAGENGDTGQFTIGITEINQNITVNYSVGGTASGSDYSASPSLNGSITLTPSSPAQTITITPNDDGNFEGTETLQLTLNPGSGYQLGGSTSASISISDNDNPPCTAPVIAYANNAPSIDESIDGSWSSAPVNSISNVTIGGMPGDYSGQWRAMYDASNLYVLVEVDDATRTNDSGGEWWNDDVIEIFIDGDNSKGTSYDGNNDFQLGFRWNDPNINIGGNSVSNTSGIQFDLYGTGSGYNLEVSIPWSTVGVDPGLGDVIGFDVSVDDDDNGGGRDSQVASIATSDAGWTNPSLFGSIYLTTCGSGPSNQAPNADAGSDQNLSAGTTSANLNGSGSDPDNDPLSYSWSQVSGPTANINNSNSANASVSGLNDGNTYVFRLTVNDGLSDTDDVEISVSGSVGGVPVPGTIEAEDWTNMDGVQTENTSDTGGGINVGWIDPGDWLEYVIEVPSSGSYTIDYRVASDPGGGSVTFAENGVSQTTTSIPNTGGWQSWTTVSTTVNLTAGTQTIRLTAATGGWNINWWSVSSGSTNQPPNADAGTDQNLSAGTTSANLNGSGSDPDNDPLSYSWSQVSGPTASINNSNSANASVSGLSNGNSYVFRLTVDDGSLSDTDDVTITVDSGTPDQTPFGGTPWSIPGTIEAEDFDNGGEGVAYHDTNATNEGGQGRTSEGVDTEICSEGGLNVGWTGSGEWLEYTVNVTSSGTYDFDFRVASTLSGGTFHVEFDGVNKTGTITSQNTGDWQTWSTVSVNGVSLDAGQQVMRIALDNPNHNIDKVIISSAGSGNQAPNASAGSDQNLSAGTTSANLTGSGSDPDNDPLSYSWSQVSGPTATINDGSSASASVSGLSDGNTYVFRLTVSDGQADDTDDVQVTVNSGGTGETTYRIRNAWQNTYLADGGDRVTYSASPSGSSYEWVLEDVGEGYQEIRNVATGEYMHIENLTGYVQCTSRTFGWYSSRWAVEDAGSGETRIRNAWQSNNYIHVENLQGHAQHGTIYMAWASAKWVLEQVGGSSRMAENVVEESGATKDLVVYPNPVSNGEVTFSYNGKLPENATLEILDLSGVILFRKTINTNLEKYNLTDLSPGVYMLRVKTGQDRAIINRLIVR